MKPKTRIPRLAPPPPALVRMRLVAGALLLLMAALFAGTRALGPVHPVVGYLRAFAEAAMVGGLADWFAVTALFRHPLGLPIPHTAIVPRNKDRIGDTLATFLRDNFLTPGVVARRMGAIDVAGTAGRWLAQPQSGNARLRHGAARLFADMLDAFDQQRLGGMVKTTIGSQLRALDVAPLLGQAIDAAIAEDRHLPLMDSIIQWAAQTLATSQPAIRKVVHERAGGLLRWTGLDVTIADKIIDGLDQLLAEMASNSSHELREKVEEGLARLAADLQSDAATRARVEALKLEVIANPAMQRWLDGLWESARHALLRVARDPDVVARGRVAEALRQLGQTLQTDPRLRATINRFVRRAVVGVAANYGSHIVRLVSETVRRWDAGTISRRLENAVGRDLQYIRINGTLVGGLVGVAIHAIDRAF